MRQRVSALSNGKREKMFSCTFPRSQWKVTSPSMKGKRSSSKSRRVPRAFRLRTLRASSYLFSRQRFFEVLKSRFVKRVAPKDLPQKVEGGYGASNAGRSDHQASGVRTRNCHVFRSGTYSGRF